MPEAFDPTSLKFNSDGLVACIAQDSTSHEVLMLAWMNAEAVQRTLDTRRVTYWSRSRQSFWSKGETSGHTQDLVSLRVDCDRDCLIAIVIQTGAACHTGRRTCFYTDITDGKEHELLKPMD